MKQYSLRWRIQKGDANLLIKDFLKNQAVSRRALSHIKYAGGQIMVNDVRKTVRYHLQENDVLEVIFPEEKMNATMQGEDIPLSIVYEDADIIVIDKPPHMNTIPSREHPAGSVANALVYYFENKEIHTAIHIVTRLDRNTSGLVLVAKHRHAHHLFSQMQQAQSIRRYYEAFVEGDIQEKSFTINEPIGRKLSSIIEREVRADGQAAITHLSLIQSTRDYSHVHLELETGRTHQIRVHLAHIGHPLLGDELYGGNCTHISRQALHCKELHFVHPFKNTKLVLQSDLPDDMKSL